ncbi:MAG TPA: response regulator [Bdellovibrio sp.]|nr:response regulator [Bdellovibrio sp.]
MAKILIVDDQKSVLMTLDALLGSAGYVAVPCTNAIDAIQRLTDEPFDLVITDAIMPGGSDGYALTRTIRKQPKLAKMPIILLTGRREKSDVEKGIESGVNDYVIKPIDPELLLAKIKNLLTSTKQETTSFLEAAIKYKAEWETKTEIISVSELGLTLRSNISMPLGKIVRVNSPIFGDIGINKPALRVDACEEIPGLDAGYKVHTQFVGLTEKELTPLRLWIRSKS